MEQNERKPTTNETKPTGVHQKTRTTLETAFANYNFKKLRPEKRVFKCPRAREIFMLLLEKNNMGFLPEYEKVVKWLEDNEGKGLLLFGDCGRGKTLLAEYVIPQFFGLVHNIIFTDFDAKKIKEEFTNMKMKKFITVDELGLEPETINEYGNIFDPMFELLDHAEKINQIIIFTTNFGYNELEQKYETRGMERLLSITQRIGFKGDSQRNTKK